MRASGPPTQPEIPEPYLDRRGVVWLRDPGADEMIAHASGVALISGGHERRIWTLNLTSPMRQQPDRWRAAMRHVARGYLPKATTAAAKKRKRKAKKAAKPNA